MAINGIPEVLNDYNAYLSGNRLVGTTGEVKLPDLEGLTETIKGCGILGEFEIAEDADGTTKVIDVKCRIDTAIEIEYVENGGVLHYVLRNLAAS